MGLGALGAGVKAGGTEVLIDREHFEAGRAVVGQMDKTQDEAERQLIAGRPITPRVTPAGTSGGVPSRRTRGSSRASSS